jgi:glycosyltransferase involved in cell wall biosynthesis
MPSLREGLPVSLIEAIYTGIPIISTNIRGNKDVLKGYPNGYLYEPHDLKKLIELIHIVRFNPKIPHKDFSCNQNFYAKFEYKNVIKSLEEIFQ